MNNLLMELSILSIVFMQNKITLSDAPDRKLFARGRSSPSSPIARICLILEVILRRQTNVCNSR